MTRQSLTDRRDFLKITAAAGAGWVGGTVLARAAESVPSAQLLAEQVLPDIWLGSKDAPVTIVEYASMTCTHCAAFHEESWPTLKSKYIDTGKVRFVLREFPLDAFSTAAFMLTRCNGADGDPGRHYALVDLLFSQQKNWAFGGKPLDAMAATVKQAGISQSTFDACLSDKALFNKINKERDAAGKAFKVEATPTFFINGEKHPGELSVDELEKILTPLMKS